MFASWIVAIKLTAAYQAASAFGQLNAATNNAQNALKRLNSARQDVAVSLAGTAGVVGGAMLAYAKAGIDAAGNYEMKLQELQFAAGLTADKMKEVKASILSTNVATAQNLTQTTAEYAAAIEHGLTIPQLLAKNNQGMDLGNILANYAHIQQLYNKIAPEESVSNAVMIAHQEGVYDPAGIAEIVNKLNRLQLASGVKQNQMVTQGGYYIQIAKRLGLTTDKTLDMMAQMSIAGLARNKGGAGIADLLLGIAKVPSDSMVLQGKLASAYYDLGITDKKGRSTVLDPNDKLHSGKISGDKLWEVLTKASLDADKFKNGIQELLAAGKIIGGVPAERVLLQLFSPQAVAQNELLKKKEANIPDLETMIQQSYTTWNGAMGLLKSNLDTFNTVFWDPLIKRFAPNLKQLADKVGDAIAWVGGHPTQTFVASLAFLGTALAGVAAGIYALFTPFRMQLDALKAATAAAKAALAGVVGQTLASGSPAAAGAVSKAAAGGLAGRIAAIVGGIGVGLTTGKTTLYRTLMAGFTGAVVSGFMFLTKDIRIALAAMSGIGIVGAIQKIVSVFGSLWLRARIVGWAIGAIAVQFIPFVDIAIDVVAAFMAINWAIQEFIKHPDVVGKWVGKILGWINYHLIPDTLKLIQDWSTKIWQAFQTLLGGIIHAITHPDFGHSWWNDVQYAFKQAVKAGEDAYSQQDPNRIRYPDYTSPPGWKPTGAPTTANATPPQPVVSPITINVNGADHATTLSLATAVASKVKEEQDRTANRSRNTYGGLVSSPYAPQTP